MRTANYFQHFKYFDCDWTTGAQASEDLFIDFFLDEASNGDCLSKNQTEFFPMLLCARLERRSGWIRYAIAEADSPHQKALCNRIQSLQHCECCNEFMTFFSKCCLIAIRRFASLLRAARGSRTERQPSELLAEKLFRKN